MTLRQVTLPGGSAITHPDGVTDDGWERPADWLPLPTLIEGDQKLVLLMAVYPHEANFAYLTATTPGGNFVVDWGDGSAPVILASNGGAAKNIAYADATALTSRGYRQVLVTVTPQAAASLTGVHLTTRSPTTIPSGTSAQWLDIALVGASVNVLNVSGTTAARMLERFAYVGPSAITTNGSSRFQNASSLQRLEGTQWTSGITNFTQMFLSASSLQAIPALNTAAGTNFVGMFSGCSSLQTVPLLSTAAGTGFGSMFQSCASLHSIPPLNVGAGTNFANMFAGCSSLRTVPSLNTAAGTDFSSMFSGCSSLQSIPPLNVAAGTAFASMINTCPSLAVGALSGTRYSISYASCKLSAAELNAIYTALGTAVGGATITVTGNYGTTGDDPSIATAKSWVVTG